MGYWLLGMALPVLHSTAVYVPAWIFGLGEFARILRLLNAALSAGLYFPLYLAAAGEELGCPGVLVPNLAHVADAKLSRSARRSLDHVALSKHIAVR
jgi:hypothetical protein